jgi:hypothetical protein
MVYGVWCMGAWCMAYGVWRIVYGVWCMVHATVPNPVAPVRVHSLDPPWVAAPLRVPYSPYLVIHVVVVSRHRMQPLEPDLLPWYVLPARWSQPALYAQAVVFHFCRGGSLWVAPVRPVLGQSMLADAACFVHDAAVLWREMCTFAAFVPQLSQHGGHAPAPRKPVSHRHPVHGGSTA